MTGQHVAAVIWALIVTGLGVHFYRTFPTEEEQRRAVRAYLGIPEPVTYAERLQAFQRAVADFGLAFRTVIEEGVPLLAAALNEFGRRVREASAIEAERRGRP